MDTVIIISVYLLIILFEYVPVIKGGNKKEILCYSSILLVTFAVLMLKSFFIEIFTFSDPIKSFIEMLIPKQPK